MRCFSFFLVNERAKRLNTLLDEMEGWSGHCGNREGLALNLLRKKIA